MLKVAGSKPATPTEPSASPIDDAPPLDASLEPSNGSDKPFDDQPFDAGVEADEESDPKKFIEQLTGKLGQSLRKYNEAQGQPDFELEKFAINSLLSASHTSEMDTKDQDDIIKKVKEAGKNDNTEKEEPDTEVDPNNSTNPENNSGASSMTSTGSGAAGDMDASLGASSAPNGVNEEMDNLFVNPKKNNMFQPNSNDILEVEEGDLKMSEKNSIFDKNKIKTKLKETFNKDEMSEPITEPLVKPSEPITKPEIKPSIAPSRKNKPFLPMPEVKPDPKAKTK